MSGRARCWRRHSPRGSRCTGRRTTRRWRRCASWRSSGPTPGIREALALLESAGGEQREHLAHTHYGLGTVSLDLGRGSDAVGHLEQAIALLRARFGPVHTDVAATLISLGQLLYQQERYDSSVAVLRSARAMSRTLFGERPGHVTVAMNTLARPLGALKQYAAADSLLRAALVINRGLHGPLHREVGMGYNSLAWNWMDQGRLDSAEVYFRLGLAVMERISRESGDAALLHGNLGTVLRRQGRPADAEPHMRRALAVRSSVQGDAHPLAVRQRQALAELLGERGRPA